MEFITTNYKSKNRILTQKKDNLDFDYFFLSCELMEDCFNRSCQNF